MTQATLPVFHGSKQEQALARRVWEVITKFGIAYAHGALIRQTASNIATFLSQDGQRVEATQVDAAVRKNPDIFGREERDGEVIIGTTREGRGQAVGPDLIHTFRQRLYAPERPLPTEDLNNIVTLVKPVITVVEPVQISPYWRGQRAPAAVPVAEAPGSDGRTPAPVPTAEPTPLPSAPTLVSPAAMAAVGPSSIVLSDGSVVDLRLPMERLVDEFGLLLQAEVRAALEDDPLKRVVSFGDYFYASEALPNLGKNDLRRIRDLVLEQGEPLADHTIVTDLRLERPGTPNFDLARFSVDYRLAKEKDFEFVGVPGMHLWSTKGLPALGTKRLKASDVGQLYSYLTEGFGDEDEVVEGLAQHTLTFFEWEYGILPLNSALELLFPPALLPDQRTAVIRIESLQHYSVYLCELRFATGTRGGWIWGLDEFFRTYLVPGVTVTLQATEDPTLFTIQYEEAAGTETKLLHLDEKRSRFAFLSVTYYAKADESLLPSQNNYNKLRNLKLLPLNDRKRPEAVLKHVFETVGEQLGSKEEPLYWMQFNELWLAINVLRPLARSYLENLLSSDDIFYADETTVGAHYYKPLPEADETVAVADDDASVLTYDEDEE